MPIPLQGGEGSWYPQLSMAKIDRKQPGRCSPGQTDPIHPHISTSQKCWSSIQPDMHGRFLGGKGRRKKTSAWVKHKNSMCATSAMTYLAGQSWRSQLSQRKQTTCAISSKVEKKKNCQHFSSTALCTAVGFRCDVADKLPNSCKSPETIVRFSGSADKDFEVLNESGQPSFPFTRGCGISAERWNVTQRHRWWE